MSLADLQHLKVVLLGETGSGKSSILAQHMNNLFKFQYEPTLGANYTSEIIEKHSKYYRVNFWDTSGHEKFGSISTLTCRNSDLFLLVCDITSPTSFASLCKFYSKINEDSNIENSSFIIVLNKIDLQSESHDTLIMKIEEFADKIGAPMVKTSAKDNTNIKELFEKLNQLLLNNSSKLSKSSYGLSQLRHTYLLENKHQRSSKCC